MRRLVLAALIVAGLSGCGRADGPTAPSVIQVAGTWVGTITSHQFGGIGPARVTIAQSNATLAGTWSATGPGGSDGGLLSGLVSDSGVAFTLTPNVSFNCPLAVFATVNGNQMTGTYTALNCTVPVSGGLTLTKQ